MERQINQDGDTVADAILEQLKRIADALEKIQSNSDNSTRGNK